MTFARFCVKDTVVASFLGARLDARVAGPLRELEADTLAAGARRLVVDVASRCTVDAAGLRLLAALASRLPGGLALTGLDARGRALAIALRLEETLELGELWSLALADAA